MAKGKRNRKSRNRGPRQDGKPKSQEQAELEGELKRRREPPRDPAGVLSRHQPNPPRVVGHVPPEVEHAILD